jgi:hypothetical protein
MSENQRKLLPYEHQLIEALGVTKDEYLDFVSQQHIYSDAKEGTILDARNWEIAALVIAIIGVLFQVASALLMPKPSIPQMRAAGQAATRDEIFAPRFGFNNAQQLAAYGDPINLIYANTDTNPAGGVRAATALIWSAVQSYGNSQLVQLLFVIGAGGIDAIDESRSAFGQTALRDLIAQNYWTYFSPSYTGALRNGFLRPALDGQTRSADPTADGTAIANPYRVRTAINGGKSDGFSHAYSPTASNTFGVYGVVPINIDYNIRNEAGSFVTADNRITMNNWSNGLQRVSKDQSFTITLEQLRTSEDNNLADEEANDARQTLSTVFDNSGLFKFGSAKLKVLGANRANVVDGPMIVSLRAVENGRGSVLAYSVQDKDEIAAGNILNLLGLEAEYNTSRTIALSLLEQDRRDTRVLTQGLTSGFFGATIGSGTKLNARQLAAQGNIYTIKSKASSYTGRGSSGSMSYSYAFVRNLTADEIATLNRYAELEDILAQQSLQDDLFYIKSVCRVEEAAYETISPCNIVDFSIRARVFKRISGRQETYGSDRVRGWSTADNGVKMRSSMFLVKVKRTTDATYSYLPGIFVVRRSADIENFVYLRFNGGALPLAHWQFKFEPVVDPVAEFSAHPELVQASTGLRLYHYLENSGSPIAYSMTSAYAGASFEYSGSTRSSNGLFPPLNSSPGGMNEWDLFTNTSDEQVSFSFDNGPEFALAAVTEQIVTPFSNFRGLYSDIALFGLNMYSGKSVQDLRSFTLFVTKGRRGRLLRTSGTVNGRAWGQYAADKDYLSPSPNGNPNTAPDIFVDTILDFNDGIGKYATLESTNLEQLARSKKFCETNQLFMDGVIAEPSSWRAFWMLNAGFSLLELAKVGGQDVLVPAVPYNNQTGQITTAISITALFNQGNILADSYKEEFIDYGSNTQDVIIDAVYRTIDAESTFARNTTVQVQLSDTTGAAEDNTLKETVDMSAFVTRREQAIIIAKFLCQVKRHSQKAIEFKTFPTDSPVFPGAYIYVELAQNQWDRIYSGTVEAGGVLNSAISPSIPNGTYSALCYFPSNQGTKQINNVSVTSNRATALAGYAGHLFVLGTVVRNRRIFRVTEVTMDEEGEVTVRGVEHGTDASGNSLISRGLAQRVSGLFTIDGRPE